MQPVTPPASVAEAGAPLKRTWVQRLGTLLFVLVCFEVGAFLLLFPWMDYWDHNSIAALAPWMRGVWDSAYFRGALSGLGLVNIYIALAEIFRLRRPRPDRLKVPVL
ncbi:MAG TPA: hypothetical protein VEV37_08615 [Bryobacteraceae bacterium]|nr:hypothetical protein [Bryobacteraceae bacterium]